MCGRYTLTAQERELEEEFGLIIDGEARPRYNIAPTQRAPVVRVIEGRRRLEELRWGLVPHWAKDIKIGSRMMNARSEEAAGKPAFRSPLRKQRCLVPCTGFYEWKPVADDRSRRPKKQPYYIRRHDGGLFALAGVWDRWSDAEGLTVETYSILTTSPNDLLRTLHDRMPVMVRPDDYALWLDPAMQDASRLQPLFAPFSSADFTASAVSTRVNSPAHDDPGCIENIA